MNNDLSGRCALVTGSGRGIGSAIALELARAGAEIVLHYVNDSRSVEETGKKIMDSGGTYHIVQADLSAAEGAAGLIQLAGNVDILVLNASVQFRKPWQQITREEFDIQVNCNFYSSLALIQQAVPAMRKKKWGRIITIGSVQEAKPHPEMLVYSSSKAAQTAMVRSLALQLAGDGITVNNIAPGVIMTDRNTEALSNTAYAETVKASIPLGFFGEKEDCAGIVRLLCTEDGRYITGQSIYVDGGKSL
ncbi:3-oxoacyl-ACP reductase [Spirochaetia bacterium]|nr:3-oxoacyl-ACP reductase [Spirochaetia bacterium]